MLLHGVTSCNADGVITPLYCILAAIMGVNQVRQLLELFHDQSLVGNVGLDVLAVGCEGDMPCPAEIFDFVKMGKERGWILGAEENTVNYTWVQLVSGNVILIVRVAYQDETFSNPIQKPFGVKGGKIRADAG